MLSNNHTLSNSVLHAQTRSETARGCAITRTLKHDISFPCRCVCRIFIPWCPQVWLQATALASWSMLEPQVLLEWRPVPMVSSWLQQA
mmetsp:Transcript_64795/g.159492  ORF Transcript_64795/g.159492 Transcript_64795/m.159492 type:complete len:88 (+) Transcript_64795:403-666(+)